MRHRNHWLCAGVESAPTIWLFLSGDHYQLVIPEQEMVLMRRRPNASPVRSDTQAEIYFLLPYGGFLSAVH